MAEIVSYTLTLNIPLEAQDDLDIEAMATMLGHAMNESMYCNHPEFFSQMLNHALTAQLKQAFRNVVEATCQGIFGHKMVTSFNGRGSTAKWLIEADKLFDQITRPNLAYGKTTVTITKGLPQ